MILVSAFSMSGAGTRVTAKLDSAILMMGRMTNLHITVDQRKGAKGNFPILSHIKENGIIGICGDSVEMRAPSKADTTVKGDRWIIKYLIPVQSFDSGYYQIPEIAFVEGRDTSYSNTLSLKVVPVVVDAKTPIDDYANVSEPENSSIFDSVPDWIYNYWWILFLVLLLIAVFIYLWIRYKKEGTILGKKPEPTPYETAIAGLKELKSKKLWEQGMEKEYFTDLTEILRVYMYRRFGINAMEMTSRQILAALKNNPEAKDKSAYIRQIVNMADFVKFAKVRPLPEDNVASYDYAVKFVEETKPLPPVEEEQNTGAGKTNANNSRKTKLKKSSKKTSDSGMKKGGES